MYNELIQRSLLANLYCMVSVCSCALSGLGTMLSLWSLENTHNRNHEIDVCKVEKIRDSQALPYTSDSITLMPHVSIDYSLREEIQVPCMCV